NPSNLNGIGWFNYTSPSVVGNYNLKSTSSYISGGTNPATDRLSIGVDYDQLQADQGYVTMGGVSNITSSSAQINFVAPDSQSCPIDYSLTDSTVTDNSLIRVPDTGTGRTRNVTITGLSSSQIYYFRINCAVNQPLGQFKTH
ncbi:MAG TPA: fibronectin type III domain-containing protein, partial [Bryobacteraceae bacterium]|nr:fibronectin type III domain-containing protein [Bryobacteraceae bacterium]